MRLILDRYFVQFNDLRALSWGLCFEEAGITGLNE
jgi:hypothetical protein